MGRKAPRKRLACRVMCTPHGCSAEHPNVSRRSAHPSIRVGEATMQTPGAKNAPRERRGVVMSAAKKRTRAEEELAAAEQRRLAPVLREAHARLRLWRTCDDKTCRRTQSCGGRGRQFRRAGLSRPSDYRLERWRLEAARIFHAQRRHNDTHRHRARAAGY